jgi:multidrug efflux system membrane fusion protein
MKFRKNHKRKKFFKYSEKKKPNLEIFENQMNQNTELNNSQILPKKNKFKKFSWVVYFLLIIAIILGLFWKNQNHKIITSSDAKTHIQKRSFKVDTLELASFKYLKKLTIYGSSEAFRTVEIIPELDAKVKSIEINDGDFVTKDQILLHLVKPQYNSLLNEAKISFANSELEYKSMQTLYKNKLASVRELQKAKALYEEDKAKLKIATDNLESLTIKAPFSAKIEEVYVEEGEIVSKYSTKLLKIIEDDRLIITGFLAESKVNSLLIGDVAKVFFSNNSEADGEITFIAGDADPDTRTFKVEVLIDNKSQYFRSGMTAKIEIPYDKVNAYKIKPSYLTLNDEGKIGIKYVENNIVKFSEVEILEESNDQMIITKLPKNISIIATGHGFVKEGEEVLVQTENNE